jgi:hypothetical protein
VMCGSAWYASCGSAARGRWRRARAQRRQLHVAGACDTIQVTTLASCFAALPSRHMKKYKFLHPGNSCASGNPADASGDDCPAVDCAHCPACGCWNYAGAEWCDDCGFVADEPLFAGALGEDMEPDMGPDDWSSSGGETLHVPGVITRAVIMRAVCFRAWKEVMLEALDGWQVYYETLAEALGHECNEGCLAHRRRS